MDIKYFFIFVFVATCFSHIQATDLHVANLLKMQQGFGWPDVLHVAERHEALLKLTRNVENMQSCEVTTPAAVTFDIRNPPSNRDGYIDCNCSAIRTDSVYDVLSSPDAYWLPVKWNSTSVKSKYQAWGDECGVRVLNIARSDQGRWRLTARGTTELTGWTEVYVEEDITSYVASPISLLDGERHRQLELTTLDNSYCLIAQPFSESSLVSGHCSMTLDRANRAVQGNWNVLVGIPGKVSELHIEARVNVEAERLDIGFVHDTSANKLNIYCNIIHTVKNITFCRFQQTRASSGYNVMDGLSDGSHSYYGDGFAARHCGMTIENPTAQDYGVWRCSVGVQMWVDTNIEQQTPLQALVNVYQNSGQNGFTRHIQRDAEDDHIVLVQKDMSLTIMCQSEMSLRYCWFQHPNGTQFTPVEQTSLEQDFWYTGESLQTGDCGITFVHVREEDTGIWTCHMGPSYQQGIEVTDTVTVRVTGPLAATNKEIGIYVGGTATLYCRTSNGKRPLNYCRFLSPNHLGISIDSTVTSQNAIMNRYYFTPDRDLDHGDCSLTINPVYSTDIGEWTCAAVVDSMTSESRDTLVVYVGARAPLSQASIIGMSVGLSVLAIILVVAVLYRRGYIRMPRFKRRSSETTEGPTVRMSHLSSSTSSSTSSSNDIAEFEVRAPVPRV